MPNFIDPLKTNFATRFDDFSISSEVMRFVKEPFCVNVEADFALEGKQLVPSSNEGFLQLELIDIQSSNELRQRNFHSTGVLHFLFYQCLAQYTLVSRTIAHLLTSICNTACAAPAKSKQLLL